MSTNETKKGITVKIDAELHAQVREYLENHEMTMTEFVTLALQDELHPKYGNVKEYIDRTFVLGVLGWVNFVKHKYFDINMDLYYRIYENICVIVHMR